jgi:hypothetical protein
MLPGMVEYTYNSSSQGEEDKKALGYIVRPFLKKNKPVSEQTNKQTE